MNIDYKKLKERRDVLDMMIVDFEKIHPPTHITITLRELVEFLDEMLKEQRES